MKAGHYPGMHHAGPSARPAERRPVARDTSITSDHATSRPNPPNVLVFILTFFYIHLSSLRNRTFNPDNNYQLDLNSAANFCEAIYLPQSNQYTRLECTKNINICFTPNR